MAGKMDNGWCILRTSSRFTIPLAETLALDGYEVWTPIETRMVRVPRKHTKREVKLPIMPSYVFAKSHRLVDLLLLEDMPVKPRKDSGAHADFTVMRAFGEIPVVPDKHLAQLRTIEAKLTPKPKAEKTFDRGAVVKVASGIFGGMIGRVERSDPAHTLVYFDGRPVKIPTLLLGPDGVCEPDTAVLRDAA